MSASAAGAAHISSSTEQQIQPSIFDVLSQDSLMNGLQPALKFVVNFLSTRNPQQFAFVTKHFNEIYALFDLLLQNHYLNKYDASFAENFYGIKRVCRNGQPLTRAAKLRSLLILVGMPYAKRRLDALHERLKEQYQFAPPPTVQPTMRDRIQQLFFVYYPTINSILEFTQLILQCGYIFSRTSVHSPWLLFAGVKLMTLTPADHARFGQTEAPKWPSGQGLLAQLLWLFRAFPRVVAAAISRLFGVGLFFIQFLEWWSQSEQRQEMNRSNTQRLPMPPAPHGKMVPLATNEAQAITLETHMCPICGKRRRNDTVLAVSGYVFCYSCIFRYITQEHRCPVTGAPAGKQHLVRLFINQVQI